MTGYTFQQSLHTRNYSEKTALEADSNYKSKNYPLKWLAKPTSSHFKLKIDGEKTLKWESSHNFGYNFSEITLKWESSGNYTPPLTYNFSENTLRWEVAEIVPPENDLLHLLVVITYPKFL